MRHYNYASLIQLTFAVFSIGCLMNEVSHGWNSVIIENVMLNNTDPKGATHSQLPGTNNTASSKAGQLKVSDIQVWETEWH